VKVLENLVSGYPVSAMYTILGNAVVTNQILPVNSANGTSISTLFQFDYNKIH
jgi:hypothetical protein